MSFGIQSSTSIHSINQISAPDSSKVESGNPTLQGATTQPSKSLISTLFSGPSSWVQAALQQHADQYTDQHVIEPLKQHVIQSPITDGATSAFTDRSEALNKAMSGQFPDMSHVMTGLKTGMDLAEFHMHGGQQKIISGELPTKQQAFEMAKAELNSHTSDTSWTNTITHPISTAQKLLEGAKAGNAVLNTSTEKRAEISQTLHAYEESQLTKIGSGLVTSFATGQLLKTGGQALFALPHPAAKLVGGGLIASGHMMTVSGLANATYKLDSFGQQVSSLEQQHGGIKQAHAMVSDFNQQQSAPLEKDKMFEHMTQFGNFA